MGDLKKGRDILADQVTTEPGVSDVGIEIRRGDERNKGVISHGYARVSDPKSHKEHAKRYLSALVGALKAQPKPNLPKSEVEKADDQEKGVHKPHFMAGKKTGTSDVGARVMSGVKPAGKTKEYIKEKHRQVLAELTAMPKPKLTKSEIEEFDKSVLDYKKLREEFKQKNKTKWVEGQRMRPRSLSVAPKSTPTKQVFDPEKSGTVDYKKINKASVQPAQVSEPIIRNRTTYSEPLKISGPNIINPMRDDQMKKCGATLKKMIGCLKKVDPKTRLPGILLDKKAK